MEAMIDFNNQNGFELTQKRKYKTWLIEVAKKENLEVGELGYVFCSDNFLLDLNQRYLQHDTLTDIITFDYREGKLLSGEIYISTDRVGENAEAFKVDFETELRRVMVHGLLHLCGYADKTEEEKELMRDKESHYLTAFDS